MEHTDSRYHIRVRDCMNASSIFKGGEKTYEVSLYSASKVAKFQSRAMRCDTVQTEAAWTLCQCGR